MAEIYVRHSLNSSKAVKFNFTLKQYVLKGDKDGDPKWVLEVGTTYPSSTGGVVPTKVVHNITESSIEAEIEKAVSELCTYIDWSDLEQDNEAPEVVTMTPSGLNVPIKSKVSFNIQDALPSSGIDLSGMTVTLDNGTIIFDITNQVEVTGDPYNYTVTWINPLN